MHALLRLLISLILVCAKRNYYSKITQSQFVFEKSVNSHYCQVYTVIAELFHSYGNFRLTEENSQTPIKGRTEVTDMPFI